MPVLVNAVEPEAVNNIIGTANKQKKVQKTIFPKEDSVDIERLTCNLKKARIKISKKKKHRTILESENPYLLT